eukprot:TRINITY_DN2473_c0_g1_i1.p2 TRINITY_DN2473_c0_g1~~TRINITY_DN2473_c0_g1_i1.p2  ORF type:complete len:430 (+),score=81.60 TRINITY_DN2473_c0_g1_i1:193-1290(+)
MVVKIAFAGGNRVFFQNRHVRTAGFVAEQQKQRRLYRGPIGEYKLSGRNQAERLLKNYFINLAFKNTANTHIVPWANQLLALWEGGRPYVLEPHSLQTLGEGTLDGLLEQGTAFSAHPHVCAATGHLVNFGVDPAAAVLNIWEVDSGLKLVQRHQIPMRERLTMIHDFAITANYCIVVANAMSVNLAKYAFGWGFAATWQHASSQAASVYVVPRRPARCGPGQTNKDDFRVLGLPSGGFFVHHANAYETPESIVLDSCAFSGLYGFDVANDAHRNPPSRLLRYRIPVAAPAGAGVVPPPTVLHAHSIEMPRIDPRCEGQRHRSRVCVWRRSAGRAASVECACQDRRGPVHPRGPKRTCRQHRARF